MQIDLKASATKLCAIFVRVSPGCSFAQTLWAEELILKASTWSSIMIFRKASSVTFTESDAQGAPARMALP